MADRSAGRQALARLRGILREHDTEPTSLGAGLVALGAATVLAQPIDTFGSSVAWRGAVQIGELVWPGHAEAVWALLLTAIGLAKVVGVLTDNRRLRLTVCLPEFGVWTALTLTQSYSNPAGTGPVFFAGLAAAALWVFVRLSAVAE